jgi:hypothetical protein
LCFPSGSVTSHVRFDITPTSTGWAAAIDDRRLTLAHAPVNSLSAMSRQSTPLQQQAEQLRPARSTPELTLAVITRVIFSTVKLLSARAVSKYWRDIHTRRVEQGSHKQQSLISLTSPQKVTIDHLELGTWNRTTLHCTGNQPLSLLVCIKPLLRGVDSVTIDHLELETWNRTTLHCTGTQLDGGTERYSGAGPQRWTRYLSNAHNYYLFVCLYKHELSVIRHRGAARGCSPSWRTCSPRIPWQVHWGSWQHRKPH